MDDNGITPESITIAPSFDYLTMQTEWRDWLSLDGGYTEETGPVPATLVAELTRRHAARFTETMTGKGVLWEPLEGELALTREMATAVADGLMDRPSLEEANWAWSEAFEQVTEEISKVEVLLGEQGLL